jgi:hypothetical protein
VLRERGLTTIFSSPGSAEVPLLAGLPDDLRFVLALHEGSVVGPATGHAPPAAPRSRSCPRRRARHRWPRSRRRGSTAPPVVVLGRPAGPPPPRPRLRRVLGGHDVVLTVGAPVFRQYPFMPGPLVEPGTRVAVVTDDPAEAHRSPAELAVLAAGRRLPLLGTEVPDRGGGTASCPRRERPAPPAPPGAGGPLRVRPRVRRARRASRAGCGARRGVALQRPGARGPAFRPGAARVPQRGDGGVGFALLAATGMRMALADRPVVAVVGDGSALHQAQAR